MQTWHMYLSFAILGLLILGCAPDPYNLVPNENLAGRAYYGDGPLDVTRLGSTGYVFDYGWNVFIWPTQLNQVSVQSALASVQGKYNYVYSYNDKRFYFAPDGQYAYLRDNQYYRDSMFDSFRGGYRYGINMIQTADFTYSQAGQPGNCPSQYFEGCSGYVPPGSLCRSRDFVFDGKIDASDQGALASLIPNNRFNQDALRNFFGPCLFTNVRENPNCVRVNYNGDLEVDIYDVTMLINNYLGPFFAMCPSYKPTASTCGERVFNDCLGYTVAQRPQCANRDLSHNGIIDVSDFAAFSYVLNSGQITEDTVSHLFGDCLFTTVAQTPSCSAVDYKEDGVVDIFDLVALINNYLGPLLELCPEYAQ